MVRPVPGWNYVVVDKLLIGMPKQVLIAYLRAAMHGKKQSNMVVLHELTSSLEDVMIPPDHWCLSADGDNVSVIWHILIYTHSEEHESLYMYDLIVLIIFFPPGHCSLFDVHCGLWTVYFIFTFHCLQLFFADPLSNGPPRKVAIVNSLKFMIADDSEI
jgi:hypothetical protein